MTDAKHWDVRITAPNGAETHFVMDDGDIQKIVRRFTEVVASTKKHDADPLDGISGVAAVTQPKRQAKKG